MDVSLFDFDLPEASIALRPAHPRDSARMLVVAPDGLADRRVTDLASLLRPGDVLVHNDTRVIPARLDGIRVRGEAVTRVEAMLHKRRSADTWRAFARPGKRLRVGSASVSAENRQVLLAIWPRSRPKSSKKVMAARCCCASR